MKFSIALITLSLLSVQSAVLKKRCAPKESYTPAEVENTAVESQQEVQEEAENYTPPKEEAVEAATAEQYTPRNSGGARAPTSDVIASNLMGDTTHFDDNEYQCYEWSFRAKNAMLQGFKFAATNYQLCSPEKTGDFKLTCGGSKYKCARTTGPDPQEYIIIDWCNPNGSEQCTVAEPGHLDILVAKEENNVLCVEGCDAYNSFIKEKTAWELVECSFEINASDFEKSTTYVGDGSEYGK
jgi:hypothetical protein